MTHAAATFTNLKRSDCCQSAERRSIMIIQPYDYVLIGWFFLAALSTLYVAVDQFKNNPEPTVMRWGFILVTLSASSSSSHCS